MTSDGWMFVTTIKFRSVFFADGCNLRPIFSGQNRTEKALAGRVSPAVIYFLMRLEGAGVSASSSLPRNRPLSRFVSRLEPSVLQIFDS